MTFSRSFISSVALHDDGFSETGRDALSAWKRFARTNKVLWRNRVLVGAAARHRTKQSCFSRWQDKRRSILKRNVYIQKSMQYMFDRRSIVVSFSFLCAWRGIVATLSQLRDFSIILHRTQLRHTLRQMYQSTVSSIKSRQANLVSWKREVFQRFVRIVSRERHVQSLSSSLRLHSAHHSLSLYAHEWILHYRSSILHRRVVLRMKRMELSRWIWRFQIFQNYSRFRPNLLARAFRSLSQLYSAITFRNRCLLRETFSFLLRQSRRKVESLFFSIWVLRVLQWRQVATRVTLRNILRALRERSGDRRETHALVAAGRNLVQRKSVRKFFSSWSQVALRLCEIDGWRRRAMVEKVVKVWRVVGEMSMRERRVVKILSLRVRKMLGRLVLQEWIWRGIACAFQRRRRLNVSRRVVRGWRVVAQEENEKRVRIAEFKKIKSNRVSVVVLTAFRENVYFRNSIALLVIPAQPNRWVLAHAWRWWTKVAHPALCIESALGRRAAGFYTKKLSKKTCMGMHAFAQRKRHGRHEMKTARDKVVMTTKRKYVGEFLNVLKYMKVVSIKFGSIVGRVRSRRLLWTIRVWKETAVARAAHHQQELVVRRRMGYTLLMKGLRRTALRRINIRKNAILKFFHFWFLVLAKALSLRAAANTLRARKARAYLVRWRQELMNERILASHARLRTKRVEMKIFTCWVLWRMSRKACLKLVSAVRDRRRLSGIRAHMNVWRTVAKKSYKSRLVSKGSVLAAKGRKLKVYFSTWFGLYLIIHECRAMRVRHTATRVVRRWKQFRSDKELSKSDAEKLSFIYAKIARIRTNLITLRDA